jgi:hypothetical protein
MSNYSNLESKRLATHFALPDLAVFDVIGADAISFLQGQITNDVAGAAFGHACLAGYCTAQGRLLASMVLIHASPRVDETAVLRGIIKRDIVASVLKRLSMFVMRSKVKLTESQSQVHGISLNQGELAGFEALLGYKLPAVVWEKIETEAGIWIAAPSTGLPRWWLISAVRDHAAMESLLSHCSVGLAQDWHALDITEGLPWIEAATQDLFIPQTLNLDLIQGVSFTKGCYPGQEIVARSHYRGTLKRRMVAAIVDDLQDHDIAGCQDATHLPDFIPGADIYDGSRDDQVCGRIINVAPTAQKTHLLIESSFDAVDHGQLRAISGFGPKLSVQPLPYPVRPEPVEK